MASARWDPTSVKALLRLTSQRLGQLQEKKDSKASITRRDIATLLQQGNVGLARAKAQNLIEEDVSGDLLEILEMHIGVLLEHFSEVDQQYVNSPVVLEAASTIIYAGTSQTEPKELLAVRNLLITRLGEDFARSAISNRENHVSIRVVHALSAPSPTAANLDMYLLNIAKLYGIQWMPEPRRQDILIPLSEILDPETSPVVDMFKLRHLCARGIPDEPAWLRPRIWRLFFGTLPVLKSSWSLEARQQRDSYYDLVRRLLEPFSDLPPPVHPLAQLDASLFTVSKQLSRIPVGLFSGLNEAPEHSGICPLEEIAPDRIKIPYANILDIRLKAIQDRDADVRASAPGIPEIRLESGAEVTPEISVSAPESSSGRRQGVSKTLVTSKPYNIGDTHPKHLSALFRLLYLHSMINPGNISPHIPALLVPLYSVLSQEIEQEDLAHVEADTFWLFEAMIGEFAELEDEEGGTLWMRKLGDRLTWADSELAESLHAKGLMPTHYAYRWLAPLLTQTLPVSSFLVIWDALFSCSMRERDSTPKLEYLLDVCTAMLIRARAALFRLGKSGRRSPSLWSEENTSVPPPSPLRAWEFGDAFVEGMSLLQLYPIEASGGIDRLLQTASDLAHRRQAESKMLKTDNLTLGARLKSTMWKGFTNQMPSPDISPPESEDQLDDNEQDEERANDESLSSGLTARLATTVWRGITNKSSMEPPPTPLTPMSPMLPPSPIRSPWPSSKEGDLERQPEVPVTATIWTYAEKLKDSDAAATFAKVSSNWRAKALLSTWGTRGSSNPQITPQEPLIQEQHSREGYSQRANEGRHSSLPPMHHPEAYYPPSRPAFFRPPRDSVIGPSSRPSSPPTSPMWSPQSEGGFFNRTKNLQDTFLTLTAKPPAPPKAGPRPLLLSASTLITTPSRSRPDSISGAGPVGDGWQHVPRGQGHNLQRDSQSSISSLSPLDATGRFKPDMSVPSRRVALNRRSISPMAPISRIRPTSESSSGTSPDRGLTSTPIPAALKGGQTASQAVIKDVNISLRTGEDTTDSEVSPNPPISPRIIRSKRYPSRPANIRTEDLSRPKSVADQQPSPQSLNVAWPEQGHDAVTTTPRAATFDDVSEGRRSSADQSRNSSGDGHEGRIRKVSGESRSRKISSGTIKAGGRRNRESAAEEGDDERGYDDLLSAYESEDG
ncbi:regulator of Vps4 activity in the MVB pathway-domain-containing protein [Mycena belliarum]|uniref:Regulator of Vps4 activity in the MVB pathway-domain-containing protein n=1 Tax=Mycena belliarum TaxID=1033014 RepID=A0AAD6UC67_9AGAR|nr:regulator of Vps4 activity in the MVB pathway-domain-containing protein [Mycena belliae]